MCHDATLLVDRSSTSAHIKDPLVLEVEAIAERNDTRMRPFRICRVVTVGDLPCRAVHARRRAPSWSFVFGCASVDPTIRTPY